MNDLPALIIIFNHRYDKNIAVLERMYRGRFSHIYYLVPFYDGDRPNVIPVYDNSWLFQGYIAQGLRGYFRPEHSHYLFIGDDLVLNPAINEHNYREHFKLEADASFIPEPFAPHDLHNSDTLRFIPFQLFGKTTYFWFRTIDLMTYKHRTDGVENSSEMPSYTEAELLLKEHGLTTRPLNFVDFHGAPFTLRQVLVYLYRAGRYRREYPLAYPVVASYSDIFIVSKESIKKFAKYCGVLSTHGLFVEFAIPTALLLAAKKVVTEPMLGKRGAIYWAYTKREKIATEAAMRPYGRDLNRLLQHFPADKLYIHPVKLSQWTS